MTTAGRLIAYGAGLAVAFVAAFALASATVPESAVQAWTEEGDMSDHGTVPVRTTPAGAGQRGLALAQDGFVLTDVSAPSVVGQSGRLTFQVSTTAGEPVTSFATSHEKDLHLIVVRNDGTRFRHVHPTLDTATGTWSTPWQWDRGGTYRMFADFVPVGEDAPNVTLTRAIDVAGEFAPLPANAPRVVDDVDGFIVSLEGDLVAGASRELEIAIHRDGRPVTTLQPYLGAFGHLVALREGDLAYVHVHAEGADPQPGQTAGPTTRFAAEAPTAGRYLLYLDFQVDGRVHTATFVMDAASASAATESANHSGGH